MAEDKLNPITGLPEKPVLSKIDNIKVQKQAFLNNLSGTQSFDTEPFATSQLDYNTYLDALGPDKFKLQFGEERLTRQLQEKQQADLIAGINQRAEDQGFFSEAFHSVMQAGLGEVVSGGVAGIGYLFDVDTLFGIAEDSGEFGNFISRFGEAAKEQTKDWFPVYQHVGEEDKFAPWDHENFFTNMPSVASMLSILIPVYGEAKAASYLGTALKTAAMAKNAGKIVTTADKLLNVVGTLGKTERWFADGLHKSIVSRRIESLMEANQTIEQTKDKYLGLGYSEEEAQKFANQAGNMNYWLNWGAMLTDLPQYLMMGSNRFMSKAVTSRKLAIAAGLNPNTATFNAGLALAGQALPEGLEEFYQYATSEESIHMIDVMNGIGDNSNVWERLDKYSRDGRALTATFFGMGGGGVTHLVTSSDKLNNIWNKYMPGGDRSFISETQARINEINDRNTLLAQNVAHYQQAIESGNAAAVKIAQKNMAFNMAVSAAPVGNLDIALSHVQQMQAMSEEDRQKLGLPEDFSDNLKAVEADMRMAANLWNKNDNKYHPSTVMPITHREYLLDHFKKEKPLLEDSLKEMEEDIPGYKDLTELGKYAAEWHSQIASLEQLITNNKDRLANNKNLTKEQKDDLRNEIAEASDNIDLLTSQYENMVDMNDQITFDQNGVPTSGKIVSELPNDNYRVSFVDGLGQTFSRIVNKSEIVDGLTKRLTNNDLQVIDFVRGKYGDELVKTKNSILQLDNQIKKITKKLAKLTSKDYQKNVAEIAERRQKMLADKKKREDQEAARAADKKKVEPKKKEAKKEDKKETKPKAKSIIDESIVGDDEESGETFEEVNTEDDEILDEIIDEIAAGITNEKTLPKELQERIKNRRNQLSNKGSLEESQESVDDYLEVGTQVIINEEPETPENLKQDSDYIKGADNHPNNKLTSPNALAWKSTNNRDESEGLIRPNVNMAKALTSYLEDYTKSLKDHTIVFEIDIAMLEANQQIPAFKELLRRLKAKEELTPFEVKNHQGDIEAWDLLGIMPIKAKLYQDGKQVVHMDQKLHLHLHTSAYRNRIDPKAQEAFDKANDEQRQAILDAYNNGQELQATGLAKSKGHLYIADKAIISPSQTLSDVIGSLESTELVIGAGGLVGEFINYTGKQPVNFGATKGSVAGAVYASIKTANGSNFPLRLQVSKLSRDEANVIHQLMAAMVKDENIYNLPLSEEFINGLNTSPNPIINGIEKYVGKEELKGLTYGQFLDHLVYNGKAKTETKGASALYIQAVKEVNGNLTKRSVVFGDTVVDMDLFEDPEFKEQFIQHLIQNRRRQIDRSALNNNAYKNYLNSNRILNTNAKIQDHRRLFVQPTVTFNGNLSKVETASNNIADKKAEIEQRRQADLATYDKRDVESLEAVMPNNPNHKTNGSGVVVGQEFKQGMRVMISNSIPDENYDGRENEYQAITKVISPAEFGKDGKMTKAAVIEVTLFNTKEDANKAIQEKYEKVKSKVGQKQKEINAKYDAELAALESKPTTQTSTKPVVTAEDLKNKPKDRSNETKAERIARRAINLAIAEKKAEGGSLTVAEQKIYNENQVDIEALVGDLLNNQRAEDGGTKKKETPVTETKAPIVENKSKQEGLSIEQKYKLATLKKDLTEVHNYYSGNRLYTNNSVDNFAGKQLQTHISLAAQYISELKPLLELFDNKGLISKENAKILFSKLNELGIMSSQDLLNLVIDAINKEIAELSGETFSKERPTAPKFSTVKNDISTLSFKELDQFIELLKTKLKNAQAAELIGKSVMGGSNLIKKDIELALKFKTDLENFTNSKKESVVVENKPANTSLYKQNADQISIKDSKMTEEIFNSLTAREQDRIIKCL